MKKIIFFIVGIAILLSGCSQPSISGTSEPLSQASLVSTQSVEYEDSLVSYDIYQITGENSVFTKVINNNPIDEEYKKAISERATTTSDFIVVEKEFLDAWKAELNNAVEKLTTVLSNNDKTTFLHLQEEWVDAISNSLNFEHKILSDDQYEVKLGSSFGYLSISQIREVYRNRTIRVKYLHYLLETAKSNEISSEECISLKFIYST